MLLIPYQTSMLSSRLENLQKLSKLVITSKGLWTLKGNFKQKNISQSLTKGSDLWPIDGRRMASASSSGGIVPQDFNYFLVLDFEATCLRQQKITPQVISEQKCKSSTRARS